MGFGLKDRVSFWKNIRYDSDTGCWNWTGAKTPQGYGQMRFLGERWQVHRLSARFYLGFTEASGLWVLHKCDNPACFNPKHLFLGMHQDNMDDMVRKGRQRNGMGKNWACQKHMSKEELNKYLRELGRRGGRARSTKKLQACKDNLKKANAARLKRRLPGANK